MAFIQSTGQLRSPVSTYTNLPVISNILSDIRITTDTGAIYMWTNSASSGILSDWIKVTSSSYNDLSGTPYSTALDIDNAVEIVTDLSVNIAILAWQSLTSFGASIVKMFDGVLNQFADQGDGTSAGIETDDCSNQILSSIDEGVTYFYKPSTGLNMTLQSVGYVANYVPTSARIVILEEDVDVIEENTDLLVYISRDGGTTFTQVTITKDSFYGDGTLNIFTGSVDISAPPLGQLMIWKLTTQNNKDCRIRGISLFWK